VNGDEVRNAWFVERDKWGGSMVGGYDASAVDDLLRRVADALDAGHPAGPLIEHATFRVVPGQDLAVAALGRRAARRRYDIEAVDWFLEELLRREGHAEVAETIGDPWPDLAVVNHLTLPRRGVAAEPSAEPSRRGRRQYLAEGREFFDEECAGAWRDFGRQPGMSLRWEEVGWRRYELRTAERQAITSLRSSRHDLASLGWRAARASLRAGGRTFTWQRPSARSWSPAVAEIAARGRRDHAGQFAAESTQNSAQRADARRVPGLVDETGAPILYLTGRNFQHRACSRVTFPDQRWLRFPVRGTRPWNAIMTAVDQAGNKVARYRISAAGFGPVEISLHPDWPLTDELALALAISAPWLESYLAIN
jgi:hypothetical protein